MNNDAINQICRKTNAGIVSLKQTHHKLIITCRTSFPCSEMISGLGKIERIWSSFQRCNDTQFLSCRLHELY